MRLAVTALGLLLAALWGLSLAQPPMPASVGLDESWRIGLTMAAEQGLRFGQDVVFTFGPLGFALQGIADPALAAATAAVTALLAAVAAGGLCERRSRGRGGHPAQAALVGIVVFVATNVTPRLRRADRRGRAAGARRPVSRGRAVSGLAVGAVGLMGLLSKYTLGLDALAAGAAVWLVERRARAAPPPPRRAARRGGCAPPSSRSGSAVAFGFSLGALGAYVRSAASISGGYSAGMALRGPRLQVAVALAVGAALGALALLAVRERKPAPALLASW